ncbi:sugar ABC transporter ATP-binding protein [Marinomonas sp. 15G1-11]|uniref:Sugar ABC transporter ATP-binding protein n=1 Tax=Marinomonas phaeophyticola TaxID=3004091 RepID=A0ABT4JX28_9GAMM|nr:sugar ABC transporter ATP-binding protein [Marinomonas sp. 15G1-11]MCZ2722961.1 sugar ABC transporter ATP-binding protein [Marinomonas sp. 15G1-11]
MQDIELALSARNICKSFAGVAVLKNVSLNVAKGSVHALIGANGAGKSTLIKIITGAYTKDSGEIFLEDIEVNMSTPMFANSKGICAVYQEFSLVNTLTVTENVYLGRLEKTSIGTVNWKKCKAKVEEILLFLESDISPDAVVQDLSVSQRQVVEIAKSLSHNAKVLILDEPTAALSDKEVQVLFKVIRKLKNDGVAVVYVSHRLEEFPQIVDEVTIYRDGKNVISLPIEEASKSTIIKHMVGKSVSKSDPIRVKQGSIAIQVSKLSSPGKFQDVSFEVKSGEVLGLTGLAGAGRTEVARALFGLDKESTGEVKIQENVVTISSPMIAKKYGIAFVTEDRREEGLIMDASISDNLAVTVLERLKRKLFLSKSKIDHHSTSSIQNYDIKCSGSNQVVRRLSGGNQQKIVVAKWMATNPNILILDEPTRGIDVGAKSQIYTLIKESAEKGLAVIVISSEIPEILDLCSRILVMSAGKLTANIENVDVSQEDILEYATQ